jgi:hypothetical protein
MISVQEVVVDPDMIAPQPFTVLRSVGQFIVGGFSTTVTCIPMFGPVQQATDKEIAMLPTNDRIGEVRSFWSTQKIFLTRGQAPVPSTHGEIPSGSGTTYALSTAPPGPVQVYAGGLLLASSAYTLSGDVLTFSSAPATPLYVTWPTVVDVATDASDIIQYPADTGEKYRILRVYRDPGGGYWKAYGTRMVAD